MLRCTTAYPFATSAANYPISKTAYGYAGNGHTAGSPAIENSIIFANVLAWAVEQVQFNGVNTP